MRPVVILGMNNPHRAGDPLSPDATAGLRLRELSGLDRDAYVAAFDRINCLEARSWSSFRARQAAGAIRRQLAGRRVVVLGRAVWRAIGLPPASWFAAVDRYDARWYLFPHPSGKNYLLNDDSFRAQANRFLMEVIRQ